MLRVKCRPKEVVYYDPKEFPKISLQLGAKDSEEVERIMNERPQMKKVFGEFEETQLKILGLVALSTHDYWQKWFHVVRGWFLKEKHRT